MLGWLCSDRSYKTVIDVMHGSDPQISISVIIPAFNREDLIAGAVASVQGQCCTSYEVIVVDDGSSDRTADHAGKTINEVHGKAGHVLQQVNGGPGAARNAGVQAARGRYLAFLDSDDFWYPQTLMACLDVLDEDPALIFLQTIDTTRDTPVDGHDETPPTIQRFEGFLEAVSGYAFTRYGSCNVVIRRDVYERLDGFTNHVRCSEDTDLFLRAAISGPCFVLSGPPLVAHVAGKGDRLTSSFSSVLSGYEFMLSQEARGQYPDSKTRPGLRDQVLAKCTAHTVLAAFATGHIKAAYGLYLRGVPRLFRVGNWHWLIRLPLVPLLVFLRPSSYSIRWTATDQHSREF